MRAFGHAVDLDLNFGSPDRPGLVTTLLAQCGEPHDPAFWWSQPVGIRTAALLCIVAQTEDSTRLPLTARCGTAACGEVYEFELPLQALPAGEVDSAPIRVRLDDERAVTVRRPTGHDLRRWREARPASRAEAVRTMLNALVLSGHVDAGDEAPVAESIATMDPLVAFTVSCRCPACGAAAEVPIDLEALALARLEARQRALLHQMHRFASRYGWTESEVFAVSPARRARYLELIEDE
jgi:hypothetical protein